MSKVRILGIDPGSRITGYGLIDVSTKGIYHVHSGTIEFYNDEVFPTRIASFCGELSDIKAEYLPDVLAVESLILVRGVSAAMKIAQARGAAICGVYSSNMDFAEYTPMQIKKAVAGTGKASKADVQSAVRAALDLHFMPSKDEADALAVALCHAHVLPDLT